MTTEARRPLQGRGLSRAQRWGVLVTVMLGTFMGPLDASIVNIALPTLAAEFGVPITTVEWVVLAYLLVISSFLLTIGRLGDMIGLKPIYLAGFAVFTAGSLACAVSWSIWALIGFRAVQAMGAGMLFAVGPAIVTRTFPAGERGKALGMVGVGVSAGLAVGPSLGGLLIGVAGWPWIFLINLPVGVAAFILAARVIPYERPPGQRFDPYGAVFSLMFLLPLLLVLSQGETWGWGSPRVIVLTLIAIAGAVGFVVAESVVAQPVLDLRLYRIRIFSASLAAGLASFVTTSSVVFVMPFYLMRVRGFPVEQAGLILTPVPLATALVGLLSGALSDRIGSRLLGTLGLCVAAAGVLSLSTLSMTTSPVGIAGRLLLMGVGMGMFQAPNTSAIMGSVPPARLGVASGMVAVARNVGMVLGVASAGVVLAVREPVHLGELSTTMPQALAEKEALLQAAHEAFIIASGICLLGALASLVRGGRRRPVPERVQAGAPSPSARAAGSRSGDRVVTQEHREGDGGPTGG